MRYTRTALGLLNAQYRSVLKKCLLINLGLFALGAGASTANAAVTLSPTLDSLKAEAQQTGAVSEKYDLKKLDANAKVPEGQAAVRIGKNVYYFSPNTGEDAKLLSILAGTPVASVDNVANPSTIKFDVTNIATKFPSSVFEYKTGTENDHNFVVQKADQDGNITKEYYKIVLNTDNMHTSPNISWDKVGADKKYEDGVVAVYLPDNQTEYYKYTVGEYNSTPDTRLEHLTADVGSATQKVLFKGLKQTSDSSEVKGGAIYNTSTDGYNIYADFIGNYTESGNSKAYGGAIYNSGTIGDIIGDFIGNYTSTSSDDYYFGGGAIYNDRGAIGSNITGDFIGNYVSATATTTSSDDEVWVHANGGAIYNIGAIGNITGDFIGNYATSSSAYASYAYGGAIYNGGTTGNITGDFIGNYASSENETAEGGAIYNDGTIGDIIGDFIGNHAVGKGGYGYAYGGAIFNFYGTLGNITGDFIGSHAVGKGEYGSAVGGAIYNSGTLGNITGDFIGNHAVGKGEYGYAEGGAIYNYNGTIGNITGDFIGNYASAKEGDVEGGAIYNDSGTIGDITGDFIGNHASSFYVSPYYAAKGGAIYNWGTIGDITGDFSGNYASSETGTAQGGAIYNYYRTIGNITGNFIGNYASVNSESGTAQGGAIYNRSTITIAGASTFTDNYVEKNGGKTSNAIHNEGNYGGDAIINFNSGNIVINDGITGESYKSENYIYKSIFNFAGQQTATSDNDVITLNNSLTNSDTTNGNIEVNLTKGTLKLGHYDSALLNKKFVGTFGEGVDFNVTGGKLTTQDGITDDHNLGNLKLSADLNTSIDVDLSNAKSDELTGSTAATAADGKKILIDNIKVLADGTNHIIKVKVADANIKDFMDLANDAKVKLDDNDLNKYLIVYEKDDDSGNLKFGLVNTLETAVQYETESNKVFAMGSDIATDTDLGALTGASLSISGSGHTIDGAGFGGMTIADNQTVSLNDVSVKGFDGAFAENNGTMNIAASAGNELNLDSGISGSGDINAQGEGKLNINSYIAANKMTVSGGELNLKSGSELANVENFVANGGVLNVGDQTVNLKKAEFNNGSTLAINVKSDGNGLLKADSLTVNGGQLKATLGQGLVDMQNQRKTVTLLESGTEFVNKFADVADNNMYRFEKADKAGDYIISLAKTAEDVSQENGGTQNNAETAKGWVDGSKFEQGSVSADVADKLADLAQNDAKGFNEALSALAPSDTPEVRTNSVNHNTEMFRAVVTHLDDVSKNNQYGLSSGDVVDGVSVWAKAFGNHAKVDNTSKAYGFKSDGYGATLGIEKQLNNAFKVGLGYSYFYNDVDGFMRDSDVNTHTGFVYGEYRPNNWYTNAIASYGYSKYDENKHVAGDVYKAKYDVDNIGAQVMTGYNASVAKVDVTPEAGLRYNNIHRDNYVDSAGQAVKAETMDVLTAVAGLKVGKDLVSCFGVRSFYWRPEARLAATYDLISDKENAVVSLSNGSGYVVKGQRLNRFGVEAGAGVTFYLSPDVESSVGYEGKFRSHYQDHTGYVSAKYKF